MTTGTTTRALPRFTEHKEHDKLQPLTESLTPRGFLQTWLTDVSAGRDRAQLRVLDLGCGRGGTVAWLLENGWDAYGLDVDQRYIDNGRPYFDALGDVQRLAVLDGDTYPYPDDHFDIVISDQVFEHVADLPALAREVERVTKSGGIGVHIFPAKWTPSEPHMHTPVAHWLPKGKARKAAIKLALRTGLAAPYFKERTLDERTEIYDEFSTDETYYRSPKAIVGILGGAKLDADYKRISRKRVGAVRGGKGLPAPLVRPAALAYRTLKQMYVETAKA